MPLKHVEFSQNSSYLHQQALCLLLSLPTAEFVCSDLTLYTAALDKSKEERNSNKFFFCYRAYHGKLLHYAS